MKYVRSLLFACACSALPVTAFAQPPSQGHDVRQSEQLAQQAYEANGRGEYQAALNLYQQAYKAAPAGVILFNIANLYDKRLKDRDAAIDYYKRYINSSDTEADLVKRASDRVVALKAEKEAQQSASTTSQKPAPAPPPTSAPQPANATEAPPDKDNGESGPTMRAVGITLGVVGLVGVGLGAGFGISATSKANRANELCTGSECRSPEGVSLTDDARTAATISTIGFVAGGALLASGVVLYLLAPSASKSATTTRISPVAMPGGAGLYLGKAW